jgi:hypothetical protein
MRTRPALLVNIIFLVVGLLVSSLLASCSSGDKPQAQFSQEVQDLVRKYLEMKQIGLEGRVHEFLSLRDSVTNAEIRAYYRMKQWVLDSLRLSNMAFNWPDIAGLPLLQDSGDGQWRRLIFVRCGQKDKNGREQCFYPVIMFRKNGDVWKFSNASTLISHKLNEDGSPRTLSQLTFHKMFCIPPSFVDLLPKDSTQAPELKPVPEGVRLPKRK